MVKRSLSVESEDGEWTSLAVGVLGLLGEDGRGSALLPRDAMRERRVDEEAVGGAQVAS